MDRKTIRRVDRDLQTSRETCKQKDIQTERQKDGQTVREVDRHSARLRERQKERWTDRQMDCPTDNNADIRKIRQVLQTDWQTGRQAGKQSDIQVEG